jgi:hypothetical protein
MRTDDDHSPPPGGLLPPGDPYRRPDGATDAEVDAAGKASEALEVIEDARGHLIAFHRLLGTADFLFEDAADLLEAAGRRGHAEHMRTEVVGRNVLEGRWTFQVIDEFDRTYYRVVKDAEARIRDDLMVGAPHVYEAEMKERRRSKGVPGHESRPPG